MRQMKVGMEGIEKEKEKEEWMRICERVPDTVAMSGAWKFETSEKETIRDYFECDFEVLDWLDSVRDEEVLFTLYVYPETRGAEWALGVWSMSGGDVGPGYDNRTYVDDEYEGVIRWLKEKTSER